MNRVYLTCNEKRVLRHVALSASGKPDKVEERAYTFACQGLQDKGFVHVMWATGHEVAAVNITDAGLLYIEQNPHLYNPVDWKWAITTAIAFATLITTLFIGCKM